MKDFLKKILGEKFIETLSRAKKQYFDGYSIKIYSQDGEDIILKEFFLSNKIEKGFYVDIGAHHPKRFSNTYMFYKKGWRGINIDAMPESMKLFNKKRKRDINLELGISEKEDNLTYYMFDESGLNGFSKEISELRDQNSNYKLIGEKKIKTYPLSYILDKYLPQNQKIDFMNIDAEGLDLEVLKSNNWNKYKPAYILVEITINDLEEILKDEIYVFLKKMNYFLVSKTYRTCIFKLK